MTRYSSFCLQNIQNALAVALEMTAAACKRRVMGAGGDFALRRSGIMPCGKAPLSYPGSIACGAATWELIQFSRNLRTSKVGGEMPNCSMEI